MFVIKPEAFLAQSHSAMEKPNEPLEKLFINVPLTIGARDDARNTLKETKEGVSRTKTCFSTS